MPTERIPLVGSLVNRNVNPSSFLSSDQVFINGYPEIYANPVTGMRRVYLNKRPGFQSVDVAAATYLGEYGACIWTGRSDGVKYYVNAFSNSGANEVKVYYGTNLAGTITTKKSCRFVGETSVSGTSTLVVLAASSASGTWFPYYYPEGGALTAVSDTDYPTLQGTPLKTVGDPCFLDGYMFILCRNGQLWNSDLNSVSSWTAGSFITAGTMPDNGVGAARLKDKIFAFGRTSIEVFSNGGNPAGSPLVRIGGAMQHIGAYGGSNGVLRVILSAGGFIYFIGVTADSGAMGIYRISGAAPEKVSNPYIDKQLSQLGNWHLAGAFHAHGMTHIMLCDITNSRAWCFCQDTGAWWKFESSGIGTPTAITGTEGFRYSVNSSSTKVFQNTTATPVYQDDGSAYTMTVRTERIDLGTELIKFCRAFELMADVRSTSGNTGIAWSDDDYATTTTAVNVDISTVRPRITRLGSFRRRSFEITDAVNAPFRAESMVLTYDTGSI